MIKPVSWIIANLLAFRALFQFIDAIFEWFFANLGLKEFGLVVRNLKRISYFYKIK